MSHVFYEITPNPQAMKFVVDGAPLHNSTNLYEFVQGANVSSSPLAQKLLGFPWAAKVSIGSHYVTVTKESWVEWDVLAEPLSELIREHVDNGEPTVNAEGYVAAKEMKSVQLTEEQKNNPVIQKILAILDNEIKPAVAMDGGDIDFQNFENGVLSLVLKGACAGCPSSMMTLKDGIEVRMKEAVPEVESVVSV